jgi:hypothetical protein
MLPLASILPLFLSKELRLLLRTAFPLLLVGLVAASPAAATSGNGGPKAHASGGGGGALIYPSIVNRPLKRSEKALDRATDYVDRDKADKAITSLRNARRSMYAAWRGAKYLIDNAPPPPVGSDSVRRTRRGGVRKSGSGGAAAASVPETAFAVLTLQDHVATTAFDLFDGGKGTLLGAANTTAFAALNRRDDAIGYIHKVAPPPPVEAGSVRTRRLGAVNASGAPVAATFDTVMPGLIPQFDDEAQQIDGLAFGGAVTSKGKSLLNNALLQITKAERKVNQWWPPIVGDG